MREDLFCHTLAHILHNRVFRDVMYIYNQSTNVFFFFLFVLLTKRKCVLSLWCYCKNGIALPPPPLGTWAFKMRIDPPYRHVRRKRRMKWGGFSEWPWKGWSRVSAWTGKLQNPTKYLWCVIPTVGPTSSSVRLHIYICRYMHHWKYRWLWR